MGLALGHAGGRDHLHPRGTLLFSSPQKGSFSGPVAQHHCLRHPPAECGHPDLGLRAFALPPDHRDRPIPVGAHSHILHSYYHPGDFLILNGGHRPVSEANSPGQSHEGYFRKPNQRQPSGSGHLLGLHFHLLCFWGPGGGGRSIDGPGLPADHPLYRHSPRLDWYGGHGHRGSGQSARSDDRRNHDRGHGSDE